MHGSLTGIYLSVPPFRLSTRGMFCLFCLFVCLFFSLFSRDNQYLFDTHKDVIVNPRSAWLLDPSTNTDAADSVVCRWRRRRCRTLRNRRRRNAVRRRGTAGSAGRGRRPAERPALFVRTTSTSKRNHRPALVRHRPLPQFHS